MLKETRECELWRLNAEQKQASEDEVFGGLSQYEHAMCEVRTGRINQLEIEIIASARKISRSAKA